jgi:hypothetical protein
MAPLGDNVKYIAENFRTAAAALAPELFYRRQILQGISWFIYTGKMPKKE